MTPKRIIKIREALGLTQQQLADRLGAQQPTVARWETGANEPKGAYAMLLRQLSETVKRRRLKKKSFK